MQHDWKKAIAAATELSKKFAKNAEVWTVLGSAQLEAGDKDGAIATYRRAYENIPDSLLVLTTYVSLLSSANNYDEARKVLQAAIDGIPGVRQ
jgi:predicted Zn-dependent protease